MVLKSRYDSSNGLQRVTVAKGLGLLREHVRGRGNEREKLNKGVGGGERGSVKAAEEGGRLWVCMCFILESTIVGR